MIIWKSLVGKCLQDITKEVLIVRKRWLAMCNRNLCDKQTIKLSRKQNDKGCRKHKQNCKTISKVKCIQIFYKKCLICPVVGRVHYREVRSRE